MLRDCHHAGSLRPPQCVARPPAQSPFYYCLKPPGRQPARRPVFGCRHAPAFRSGPLGTSIIGGTRLSIFVLCDAGRPAADVTARAQPCLDEAMRIVLGYPVEERHVRQVAAVAPDAEIVAAAQPEIPDAVLEADVFCGHAKERPVAWDQVVARGRLQWIQSSAAGMDHCLTPEVVQSPILVTSASGLFADQVAEQTLALLLGLLRGLPVFFRAAQRKEFIRRPTADLHGTTIGIAGFGGNGRRLAELLTHFRTRIWATDYFPVDRPAYVERLLPPERLAEVLAGCDMLILCVPLTDQTRGMIDGAALATMKRGCRADQCRAGSRRGGSGTGGRVR